MKPRFLDTFPKYCSLLLMGPPGVGKFEYMMASLRAYLEGGDGVVFVGVDVSPGEVLAYARRMSEDLSPHLGKSLYFVDCYTPSLTDNDGAETEGVLLVSSLSNLEGIGMAITKAAARLTVPVKILFYTISTPFLHNSSQSLSKFFQIVSARVKSRMGLIMYALHEGVTERRQEQLLQSLVDGVVEVRFGEDMLQEARLHHLRGHRVAPSWTSLLAEDEVEKGAGRRGKQ